MKEPKYAVNAEYRLAALIIPKRSTPPYTPYVAVGIFTPDRISSAYLPAGYNRYELRHLDNDWDCAGEIGGKSYVMINFMGTFITSARIPKSIVDNPIYHESGDVIDGEPIFDSDFYYDDSAEFKFEEGTIPGNPARKILDQYIKENRNKIFEYAGFPEYIQNTAETKSMRVHAYNSDFDNSTKKRWLDFISSLQRGVQFTGETHTEHSIEFNTTKINITVKEMRDNIRFLQELLPLCKKEPEPEDM